jgi:hypothetical protein
MEVLSNKTWCCDMMKHSSTVDCSMHDDPHDCPNVLVVWSQTHGPGLPVRDGGSSFITINFCPWCGTDISMDDEIDTSVDAEIKPEMLPTDEGAKALREYLDLRASSGMIWIMNDRYRVRVHNSLGRWIFSGKLVKEWNGVPVEYDFNAKDFVAA